MRELINLTQILISPTSVVSSSWYEINSAQRLYSLFCLELFVRAVCHAGCDVTSHSWQSLYHVQTVSFLQPTPSLPLYSFMSLRPVGVIIHPLLPGRCLKCKLKDGRPSHSSHAVLLIACGGFTTVQQEGWRSGFFCVCVCHSLSASPPPFLCLTQHISQQQRHGVSCINVCLAGNWQKEIQF